MMRHFVPVGYCTVHIPTATAWGSCSEQASCFLVVVCPPYQCTAQRKPHVDSKVCPSIPHPQHHCHPWPGTREGSGQDVRNSSGFLRLARITVSAAVRLSPSPPTRVDSRNTGMSSAPLAAATSTFQVAGAQVQCQSANENEENACRPCMPPLRTASNDFTCS